MLIICFFLTFHIYIQKQSNGCMQFYYCCLSFLSDSGFLPNFQEVEWQKSMPRFVTRVMKIRDQPKQKWNLQSLLCRYVDIRIRLLQLIYVVSISVGSYSQISLPKDNCLELSFCNRVYYLLNIWKRIKKPLYVQFF